RRGAIAPEQPPLAVHRRLRRELPLLVEHAADELPLGVVEQRLPLDPAPQPALEGGALLDPLAGVLLDPPDRAGRQVDPEGAATELADPHAAGAPLPAGPR